MSKKELVSFPQLREVGLSQNPLSQCPLAKKRRFREIDVEDPNLIRRFGEAKVKELLRLVEPIPRVSEVGGPAKPSGEQVKRIDAELFQKFLDETEPQTTTDETDDVDSDSETKPCEVCMKDDGHFSYDCPYLDYVPDPENTPLGKRYHIVCLHCCKEDHGHPAGTWFGRASLNLVMRNSFLQKRSEKSTDEKPKPAQPTDKSDEGDNDLDNVDWRDVLNDLDWTE